MTWNMVNIPDGYRVKNFKVYLDGDSSNKILFDDPFLPEKYARENFGKRISATITSTAPQKCQVKLNNLKYKDAGKYTLHVIVVQGSNSGNSQQDTKTVEVTEVRGE